jgi:hypothetical protein
MNSTLLYSVKEIGSQIEAILIVNSSNLIKSKLKFLHIVLSLHTSLVSLKAFPLVVGAIEFTSVMPPLLFLQQLQLAMSASDYFILLLLCCKRNVGQVFVIMPFKYHECLLYTNELQKACYMILLLTYTLPKQTNSESSNSEPYDKCLMKCQRKEIRSFKKNVRLGSFQREAIVYQVY